MAVALGGVSHVGVYPPGVHRIHVTLLILHESAALLRVKIAGLTEKLYAAC